MTIKSYVEGLFKDILDSERKENTKQEIIQDLEKKVQDLIADGREEEDAINKAIIDFGDIDEIKKELGHNQLTQGDNPKLKKKDLANQLAYSIWASGLLIGLFLFINFYYSPKMIWFVYPTFAVLWWPLTMCFRWLNSK